MSKKAELRVCMACEWIFRRSEHPDGCPMCGWASYGARYVYGDTCYGYERTQKPWYNRKMTDAAVELASIIKRLLEQKENRNVL